LGFVQAGQKKCLLGAHAALVTDQAALLTGLNYLAAGVA